VSLMVFVPCFSDLLLMHDEQHLATALNGGHMQEERVGEMG
jgi:hypothetical protein